MARENKTQFAVLGMLGLGLRTGYDMKGFVERSLGHFWKESYGALYPILKRLDAQGLVEHEERSEPGKPARKVYRATERGEQWLRDWLRAPWQDEPARNELLLKLFFGARIGAAACEQHVQRAREMARETRVVYEGIDASIRAETPPHPEAPYWRITLSYGRHMMNALEAWADETLGVLRELQQEAP